MRQIEEEVPVTRHNLLLKLRSVHPANIIGGIYVIRDFTLNEFHGGIDPCGENEHPLFESAAMLWAWRWEMHPEWDTQALEQDFSQLLSDYSKLLTQTGAYLTEKGMMAEQAEFLRILSGLGKRSNSEQQQALGTKSTLQRFRHRLPEVLTTALGTLFAWICAGDQLWRMVGCAVVLFLFGSIVWKLAERHVRDLVRAALPDAGR